MPVFFYRAYGADGALAEGQVEAASASAVNEILWAKKLVPFEVTSADAKIPWWRRDISLSSASFSLPQLASFTREFATLAAAGIPLADTLRIMVDQAHSSNARAVLDLILQDLLNGVALSDAMQKHPDSFSAEYVSVIRAAEASGAHAQALDELADLLDRRAELRARIHSALLYPVLLVILSLASLIVITSVLVPNIAPIFTEAGASPPGAIAFLMALYHYWGEILVAIFATAAAAAAGFVLVLRNPSARKALDRGKLRAPFFGELLVKRDTARFARTFGTLLKAGVPLIQAGISAADVVKNRAISASVREAIDKVREGRLLHGALRDHTLLPALALRMITIGEQAAHLDQMLLRVAELFERQTQRSLDRLMAVFTPAITLLVALLVGLLIVTIMNAVLSLNDIAIG